MQKYEDKYEKNADIEADTPIKTIISTAKFGLVVLGLVGISVEFFRDDGWLKTLITKILNSSIGAWWFLIIAILLFILNRIITDNTTGKASKRGNLPFHVMMLIGGFFLYRLAVYGEF